MNKFLAVCALALCTCGMESKGDVTLETTEGLKAQLRQNASWTIGALEYGGRTLLDNPISAQGTVLREGGRWVGSVHGNETISAVELWVNGAPETFNEGHDYKGESLEFIRRTQLGDTFELVSRMRLEGSTIFETLTLIRTASPEVIDIAYGFLGSRDNSLDAYAAYSDRGQLLQQGRTEANDGTMTFLPDAVAVAQYDADRGLGLVTVITEGAEMGLELFIWDREADNKLYSRFSDVEGVAPPGTTYAFQQKMTVFEASEDAWIVTGAASIPEPSALFGMLATGLAFLHRGRRSR